jgi:hypothetical protein
MYETAKLVSGRSTVNAVKKNPAVENSLKSTTKSPLPSPLAVWWSTPVLRCGSVAMHYNS